MVWKATRISGASPLPLFDHSATTVAEKNVYLVGGVGARGEVTNDVAIINTGGLKNWADAKVRGAPPPPRKGHSSTIIQHNQKDHLFIFGGTDGKNHSFNDSYLLHAETLSWTKPRCTGLLPNPRSYHSAVSVNNNTIVIFGGHYLGRPLSDTHVFNNVSSKNEWTSPRTTGTLPSARYGHSAALWRGKMIVFGGTDGKNILSDLHILDTKEWTWTQVTTRGGIPPRTGAGSALIDNQFYIFGGEGASGPLNDVYYLDLDSMQWFACEQTTLREGDEVPPHSGHGFTLVGKTLLYAVGGCSSSSVFILDVKKFLPEPVNDGDATSAPLSKPGRRQTSPKADEPGPDIALSPSPEPQKKASAPAPAPSVTVKATATAKAAEPVKPAPAATSTVTEEPPSRPLAASGGGAAAVASAQLLQNFATLMEEKAREVSELRERLNSTEKDLQDQKRRGDSLQSDLERARDAQGSAGAARVEADGLRQTAQSLQERLDKALAQSTRDRTERQEAEAALRARTREVESASEELRSERERAQGLAASQAELDARLKAASAEVEVLRLKATSVDQHGAERDREALLELQREVAQLRVDVADKSAALASRQAESARLAEDLRAVKQNSEAAKAHAEENDLNMKHQISELQDQVGDLTARCREAESRSTGADSLQALLREKEEQVSSVSAQLTKAREEVNTEAERRQNAERQITTLQRDIDEARKNADALRADSSAVDKLRAEVDQWKARYNEAEVARSEAEARQAGAKEESLGEVGRLTSEIARLTDEVKRLSADVSGQMKKNEQEVTMRRELEKRLADAKATNTAPSQLQNRINELEKQLDEKSEQIAQLEGEVEQWMVASEQLQKLGEEAVREVTEDADSLREEVNAITKKYEAEVRRRRDVEADLTSSEQKLNELESVLNRLMNIGKG